MVEALCDRTPEDLMKIRNFSRKCLEEILASLNELKRLLMEMGIEDIEIFKYRTGPSDEV